MGQSAPSKSENNIRPKTLSERLAAETPTDPEARAEPFAPDAQRRLNGLSGRVFIEPQRLQISFPSHRAALIARFSSAPSSSRSFRPRLFSA